MSGLDRVQIARVGDVDRFASRGIVIEIDMRQINNLLRALKTVDLGRHDFIMQSALNKGADKLQTEIKRVLQDVTGIRVVGRITQGFKKIYASAGKWEAGLRVQDTHTRITKEYYGATWNRSMPGVAHAAWNRGQIAKGAFMIPGRKPAFKRVGKDRFPIAPVWGPNMAREMDREPGRSRIEHRATAIANWVIVPEAYRLIDREMARVASMVKG